jgi:hypothetical protein
VTLPSTCPLIKPLTHVDRMWIVLIPNPQSSPPKHSLEWCFRKLLPSLPSSKQKDTNTSHWPICLIKCSKKIIRQLLPSRARPRARPALEWIRTDGTRFSTSFSLIEVFHNINSIWNNELVEIPIIIGTPPPSSESLPEFTRPRTKAIITLSICNIFDIMTFLGRRAYT